MYFLSFQVVLITVVIALVYGDDNQEGFLNIPGEQVFTDRAAPVDQSNLQSPQYQDFIRNLYRNDKENLQKYDTLFEGNAPAAAQ